MQTSQGDIKIYFCHIHDCNKVFIDAISSSTSASCAFFDINNKELEEVIEEKDVSLVIDERSKKKPLTKHIFIREGNGLMHNKFCVINDSVIITGSYNPTHIFSSRADFNTLISIESNVLAKNYLDAYYQLQKSKKKKSEQAKILHNNFLIESYFCPQDNCQEKVLSTLQSANKSISFALFTFTDKEISLVLKNKFQNDLTIAGIVESYQSKKYNQYFPLKEAGLPVVLESSDRLQHAKLFVIDNEIVILGSYNPTLAATTINDENIVIIHNKDIASLYDDFIQEIIFISSSS